RKMDEAKAKLDKAINARKQARQETRDEIAADIARLDAAIDEFDAALNTQIDKQYDTLDAQAEKQAKELDAALDLAEEKIEQDVKKAKAAFTLDKATAERVANEPTRIDEIQKGTAEQVARAKVDIAMAKENARLLREQRDSKVDSVKLRTQMKVDNAKSKVAARKEALDKAAQEEWILDLLDYANGCYEMAYAWALEAEYTMMEAAYEIDYYNERFGSKE
ncbi:MAG: hypothetical protein IKI35_08825, partial [Stomatobaculum sp.]|nr:hypothetical protein [Stomatobaculum sp.]